MGVAKVFIGYIIHSIVMHNVSIEHVAMGITGTGQIDFVTPVEPGKSVYCLAESFEMQGIAVEILEEFQAIIPGFVDTHNHGPQFENAGIGYDLELLDWLDTYTFPTEAKFADPEYAKMIYSTAVDTYLRYGTTTAMYYSSLHLEGSKVFADVVVEKGQRGLVGKVNMDRNSPDFYIEETEQSVIDTEKFIKYVNGLDSDLVYPVVTPRFAISCTNELSTMLGELAKKYDAYIQTHISESLGEIDFTLAIHPFAENYLDVYDQQGLLGPKTLLAHGIYLLPEELDRIAETGTTIGHCANSNFALQSGTLPLRKVLRKGIKVGLGTDVSGGYSFSILDAMRQARIASFIVQNDNNPVLTVDEMFYLATMGGAEALSLDSKIGNFMPGKDFDAILVDLTKSPGLTTGAASVRLGFEKYIYLGDDRNHVSVWVKGRKVV